ncbi:MAG: threonine synthase [Bacteroidota bacterium]
MRYYSTNLESEKVTFSQALLKGQAPDKGLYMPENIPQLPAETILGFTGKSYSEIAFEVAQPYLAGEIGGDELRRIVTEAYDFDVPLQHAGARKYIMRLDQGPTASFKDFAARMMGRLMQYYLKRESKKLLILTATSGDTGSAVANAFYGLDNIEIVVLFPRSEVTARQRKQMTTLGKNVRVLALDAKFDDCQALVKQAFADPRLDHLGLSSANSINIGRLIPQIVYYFYAYAKLRMENHPEKIIFSIPSGNFGDMMGGILAMKMGLPVRKLVIATNGNDEFPEFLNTGKYKKIEPSRNCISSAMNVGHPSNLARVVSLYGGMMDEQGTIHQPADMDLLRKELYSVSISDEQTKETIRKAYEAGKLLLEPHGAAGWAGLMEFFKANPGHDFKDQLCVALETAHPAKFPEEIERLLGIVPLLPASLEGLDDKPEIYAHLNNNYQDFQKYLLKEK